MRSRDLCVLVAIWARQFSVATLPSDYLQVLYLASSLFKLQTGNLFLPSRLIRKAQRQDVAASIRHAPDRRLSNGTERDGQTRKERDKLGWWCHNRHVVYSRV